MCIAAAGLSINYIQVNENISVISCLIEVFPEKQAINIKTVSYIKKTIRNS